MGPEGLPEVNCNGISHVEAKERKDQWRDEDQHNGNTGTAEECATQEGELQESPVHPICNGVDSVELKELDIDTEDRGAFSSEVMKRGSPGGLEEGELEQSQCQEEAEERRNCQYGIQEGLRNG